MKFLKIFIVSFFMIFPTLSYADEGDIVVLWKIFDILSSKSGLFGTLQQQMNDLQGLATDQGDFKDFGSWGNDAQSWQAALSLSGSGGSNSALGQEVSGIKNDFPINTASYNQANPSSSDQKYYKLQAETALAARAASQLDFDKLQQQIDYQQKLKSQIYKTQSIKESVDLQNRLQVENNLINLELLRQMALINQQQSVDTESDVNSSNKNAQFMR